MDFCISICLMFIGAAFVLKTEAEILPWLMARDIIEVEKTPEFLQHLQEPRQKRHALPEGGSQCCQQGAEKKNQANEPKRVIVHHYHHHYYYCCPSVPQGVKHGQNTPHSFQQNPPHPQAGPNASVCCSQDTSGSVSCSVTGGASPQSTSSAVTEKPQTQNANGVFGFSMMIDDPVGKEFLDFISKNFVKKETPGQPNECKSKSGPDNFEDPVCKEFFNFFSKNFMRKPQQQTPAPLQAQNPPPTEAQKQVHPSDFKDLNDIKNMFSSLKDEMKDTFSMAKKIEKDIRGIF